MLFAWNEQNEHKIRCLAFSYFLTLNFVCLAVKLYNVLKFKNKKTKQ